MTFQPASKSSIQISERDQQRQSLRRKGRAARRAIHPRDRRIGTQHINQRLINRLRRYKRIALYLHFDGEPDLLNTLCALANMGKILYIPLLNRRGEMCFIDSRSLGKATINQYSIIEPGRHSPRLSSKRLQAVVMPLTAYDGQGQRLGMGAGYYDRNLHWQNRRKHWLGPKLIGSAWASQQTTTIPAEPWDRPLNALVNEKKLLTFRKPQ